MSEPALPNSATAAEISDYTFVLRLDDRPGAMELIAATFAHRGISLTSTLGNDGTLDPSGCAVVLVHFHATLARKEALKRTLTRLSRVQSLVEHDADDRTIRRCALARLAVGTEPPAFPVGVSGTVEIVALDAATGEATFAVIGPSGVVMSILENLGQRGELRAVMHAVLAL